MLIKNIDVAADTKYQQKCQIQIAKELFEAT